ncbi:hypothetical protein LOTGIDRAFT_121482 [Lottia gigantea]|uniref:TIR domain-containing protein n=1 Tax=Lottia gigantea TaxID=225164 RepID=V3ZL38_LOTGI|nr:hypothetical protein LOTGIDRAFT_121482 [Lottia gigantea]ESO92078.1 hypothetical protein LOTGIDRAFT_121482 [Lottia gigantea]
MQRKIKKYKGGEPPKYVAFMCYSHHDSEFVLRHIRPEIERRLEVDMSRSEGLLCINDRDFRVGEPIEEAIVRSVLASSMIILIISEKFMDSQWCKFEMNIAWLEKKPILMILKERVLVRKLPYLLKNIYNKNTRLTWTGENRKNEFIENLYKSMLNKL